MSYNIDTWKTKKLENLNVPISAFYKHERSDWHPTKTILDMDTKEIALECVFGQIIKGILSEGVLSISEFEMHGEGSGTFKGWILDEALKESTGELEAVLVWEGGDSITRLNVKDGKIAELEVEL